MRKLTALGLVAALFLTSCTTTNPYTGEEETSKATKGAAIGAATGAVAGLITGGHGAKRALIGAGIGALAGGAVGGYMDQQEAELRKELQGTGVGVTRQGDRLVLDMPSNVTFQHDSADLNARFFDVLNNVAKVLQEYEKTVIHVAGYTDSTGSEGYNQRLSERRAEAVASYLRAQGILEERIVTRGYGETHFVADNSTPQGRAQNRRVELTLEPVTR
ncbi:OmpA family protein [Thiohalorhabdus sp. Cl-TMA]|uniref:OmpA family protein n=1 Tax=Thiohalorhabdus methylotrophus TaxID=3242694 RepID=A0ABV4TTW2_9GAMM